MTSTSLSSRAGRSQGPRPRRLEFVEHKVNVAFLGPTGVGKTMLAVGPAIAACRADYSVYFTTLDDLVHNLKEASGRLAKNWPICRPTPNRRTRGR